MRFFAIGPSLPRSPRCSLRSEGPSRYLVGIEAHPRKPKKLGSHGRMLLPLWRSESMSSIRARQAQMRVAVVPFEAGERVKPPGRRTLINVEDAPHT